MRFCHRTVFAIAPLVCLLHQLRLHCSFLGRLPRTLQCTRPWVGERMRLAKAKRCSGTRAPPNYRTACHRLCWFFAQVVEQLVFLLRLRPSAWCLHFTFPFNKGLGQRDETQVQTDNSKQGRGVLKACSIRAHAPLALYILFTFGIFCFFFFFSDFIYFYFLIFLTVTLSNGCVGDGKEPPKPGGPPGFGGSLS